MKFRGTLRFDDFMARALHDPQHGYYACHIRSIGQRGDFTTAPALSPALGRAIARWATHALRESSCRDLIELGPGEGTLAATVRQHLPWQLRWRTRLHLVESSPILRQRQQATLGHHARWHSSPAAALAACRGRAVIYSNELVDAFPVRRFHLTPHGWHELFLDFDAPSPPAEILRPCPDRPPSTAFDLPHPTGQWIEVHDTYRTWLGGWLPAWTAGRMLTIDYGQPAAFLYHRRPHGTLRAYLLHQRLEHRDCYLNPGRQDLTTDVNFSDLIDWSENYALKSKLMTLNQFIAPFADPSNATDRALLDPLGAGGAFQVLEQSR